MDGWPCPALWALWGSCVTTLPLPSLAGSSHLPLGLQGSASAAKSCAPAAGRGAELRAGETSRNKCCLPPELSRCSAGCRGARGLFAPALCLHTGQTDRQTDRQRHRGMTDSRHPTPSPWDAGRHKAAQCLNRAYKQEGEQLYTQADGDRTGGGF